MVSYRQRIKAWAFAQEVLGGRQYLVALRPSYQLLQSRVIPIITKNGNRFNRLPLGVSFRAEQFVHKNV